MRFSLLFSLCTALFFVSGCFFSSPQTYHDTVLNHAQRSADSMEDFIAEYLQFSEEKMDEQQYIESVKELRNTLQTTIAQVEKMGGYRGDNTLNTDLLAFLNAAYTLVSNDIQEFIVISQAETVEDVDALKAAADKMQTSLQSVMKHHAQFQASIDTFQKTHSIVSK